MNEPKWRSIFDAARQNDEQAVRYFIEQKGIPPNETNTKGQTVAHIAAMNGNIPMLEYILNIDSSVLTTLDRDKNNVLFVAIERGAFDLVQFLVECYQMDILQTNRYRFGVNAVHIAAKSGNLDILQYFVEGKGADVNVKNNLLETPVFYAAEEGQLVVVQYLVEVWNANVTCVDWNGDNILYASAKCGDLSVPKYLMDERGVVYDINGRDKSGDTIVNRAVRFEHLEFIRYFVQEKGADVNIADNFRKTPLYNAATLDNFGIVKFLLDSGADIQIGDLIENKTPDKCSTVDKVIKLLKKTMADTLEKEKQKAKEEKDLERQKVKEVKELKEQKLKEEKRVERQKVKEEKESEKQKLREEKKKLKEEKDMLKNTTVSAKAGLKKLKNATERNSTSRSSNESMSSSDESTANLSFEPIIVSNNSRESDKPRRSRRNAMDSYVNFHSVDRSSYPRPNGLNSRSHNLLLSTASPRLKLLEINSFLIIVDVCFRYLNLLRGPRIEKSSLNSRTSQEEAESRIMDSFVMKSIRTS